MTILEKLKDIATDIMSLQKQKVNLIQMSMDNGTVLEAESFEPEQPVFIVNEDQRVPLPVGQYELAEGMLIVIEEGIINEMKKHDMATEEKEVTTEFVTKDDFNKAIDDLKSMLSKQVKDSEVKVEKLSTELSEEKEKAVDLQKTIDETPDAEAININEKVNLNQAPALTKKGRIYQFLNNR